MTVLQSLLSMKVECSMLTKIVRINEKQPETEKIAEAAAIIRDGGLVAFPTETVYGLGADALLAEGSKRIYAAKGRPSDNPLIVHIAEFGALERIAAEIPPQAKVLADVFWPGPLTMIFNKSEAVPRETTGGLDTVAVRMPSHPVALELIRESGGYIAAPSANTSGRPSPTTAQHVYTDLNGRIPMILDGGAVGIGIESTIIDLSGISKREDGSWISDEIPMILRPGYITREMLTEVIGSVCDDPGFASVDANVRPKAPGMKYRHYAPKAEMTIVRGDSQRVAEYMNDRVQENREKGLKTGLICTVETENLCRADVIKCIGSRADGDSVARHLYAILREFDDLGVDRIYSESFDDVRIGRAIMNRLMKAAGQRVVNV